MVVGWTYFSRASIHAGAHGGVIDPLWLLVLTHMSVKDLSITNWGLPTNCGKFLKRWEYQTTLPASCETCMQVQKQQLELDMEQQTSLKLGKEYVKAVMLSSCLFHLYAESIMWNAGLDEAQAGIKIAGRNINTLRYADDTTLMAESEEELNSLLMKVKEESEKAGLKLNILKTKIMASGPITSWQISVETGLGFIFLGSKITADGDYSHEIKRDLLLEEKLWQT